MGALAMVAGVLAVPIATVVPPAAAGACVLKPELRASTVNQGLGSYSNLVRGKETLVRLYLSEPAACGGTGAVYLTGIGSADVFNDVTATAARLGGGALYSPTTKQSLPNPYTTAPLPDSPYDPIFTVPAASLVNTSDAGFTARFKLGVQYTTSANSLPQTEVFSVDAAVGKKSNALRILVQPVGDGTRTASEQYAYTTDPINSPTYDSTEEVMQSAFQSLSRQLPVPGGVTPTLDLPAGLAGGIRWQVSPGVLDVKDVPGAWLNGQFCATPSAYQAMEPRLRQRLLTWNADNPTRLADRILAVADSRGSSAHDSCYSGFGSPQGMTAFVEAEPDATALGGVSPTGGLLTMELTHNAGLQSNPDGNPHAFQAYADGTAPDRAYNATLRKYLKRDDNHTAMKYSHIGSYFSEDNTLLEKADYEASLCALGGPVVPNCGATGAGGTTFGVAAGPSFYMSGTTDGTPAGTSVVESFFAVDAGQCQPPVSGKSNTCAPSSTSPYRLLQLAGNSSNVLVNQGVAVNGAHDGHSIDTAGAGTNYALTGASLPFSVALEGLSAGRIQFYYCPPSLSADVQAACKSDPRATGTLLYERLKQPAPPSIRTTTRTAGGRLSPLTTTATEIERTPNISYDGNWVAWARECDPDAFSCVDGIFVAPVSAPTQVTAVPNSTGLRDPAWNPAGDALAFVNPSTRELYLQPISTAGPAVRFGNRLSMLTPDLSKVPSHPTFTLDGTRLAFALRAPRFNAAIYSIDPRRGTDQQATLLIGGSGDISWPSASRTPGDSRIAYTVGFCRPYGCDAGQGVMVNDVFVARSDGTDPQQLVPGSEPSFGDDGRIVFRQVVDGYSVGLASVDAAGRQPQEVTRNSGDVTPNGAAKGRLVFTRHTTPTASEVMVVNTSQTTVVSTVSSAVPGLLVGDLIYECRGTKYPIAVGVRPTSVQAAEATFEAVFDPSLACGGADVGRLYFQVTDGIDRASGSSTAQTIDVADKSPTSGIHSPREGSKLGPLATLVLDGAGRDAEAADVGLSWKVTTSNSPARAVGTGQHLDVPAPAGGWPAGQIIVELTATDSTGKTGTTTRRVTVTDAVAPALVVTHTADGSNGWNRTPSVEVSVTANDADSNLTSLTCADGGAGLTTTPAGPDGTTYAGSVTVSGQGAHRVSCTVTDTGGNTTTATDTVLIDSVSPRLTGSQSPQPNGNGWNAGDVTIAFDCADDGSGLSSLTATGAASGSSAASPLAVTVTTEGAAQNVNGVCSDVAGNTASSAASVSIDRTLPTVDVQTPVANATYPVGASIATSFTCADALSGVASCTGPASLDTATVGSKTATFTGVDRAGNPRSVTVAYKVSWIFEGFLAPVNNPPTVNSGKAGRTYPVKWRLKTAAGTYVTSLASIKAIRYTSVSCATWLGNPLDALEAWSSGSSQLRNSSGMFVYDWQTPSSPGCYVLSVILADGVDTTYSANFNLGLS